MSTISITKKHHLTHKAARAAAQKVAADLQQRFGLHCEWDGDRCTFERSGISGELVVGAGDVRLACNLGFLLAALRPAIEREVHREFDARFGKSAERG